MSGIRTARICLLFMMRCSRYVLPNSEPKPAEKPRARSHGPALHEASVGSMPMMFTAASATMNPKTM